VREGSLAAGGSRSTRRSLVLRRSFILDAQDMVGVAGMARRPGQAQDRDAHPELLRLPLDIRAFAAHGFPAVDAFDAIAHGPHLVDLPAGDVDLAEVAVEFMLFKEAVRGEEKRLSRCCPVPDSGRFMPDRYCGNMIS
jgi:hypothetical protein